MYISSSPSLVILDCEAECARIFITNKFPKFIFDPDTPIVVPEDVSFEQELTRQMIERNNLRVQNIGSEEELHAHRITEQALMPEQLRSEQTVISKMISDNYGSVRVFLGGVFAVCGNKE